MTFKQALQKAYDWKPGRTFAQALAAAIVAAGTGLLNTDWRGVLSIAAMAGLLSFLQAWADGKGQFATSSES